MAQQLELFQGHFFLTSSDLAYLPERPARGRLGFAILLSFFQLKGRFPQGQTEIPKLLIDCISEQLGINAQIFQKYKWKGRTIERHRTKIRSLLGFREATVEDLEQLQRWLLDTLENNEFINQLDQVAYEHLQQLQIEPPTKERLERSVNSVISTHEQRFHQRIFNQLSEKNCQRLEALLDTAFVQEHEGSKGWEISRFAELQKSPGKTGLESVLQEVSKLQILRELQLPSTLFLGCSPRFVRIFQRRAAVEPPRELRRHPATLRYSLLSAFCWGRAREITDHLVELLIQVVHRIGLSAEKRVTKELLVEFKRVQGKDNILFLLAEAALEQPDGVVREVLFPIIGEKTLQELVKEFKATGPAYRLSVQTRMKSSYSHHYRRMLPKILSVLEFRSNNVLHRPVIEAVELLTRYKESRLQFYPVDEKVPIDGVVKDHWRPHLYKNGEEGGLIHRISYEICVLEALRERLRSKEIWVVGADRWRNPDEDLPQDFGQKRQFYYEALAQPLSVEGFISQLQERMHQALAEFDQNLPKNPKVSIRNQGKKLIKLSPLEAQLEAPNIRELKQELLTRWPMTNLLDVLKETDGRNPEKMVKAQRAT